LSPWAVQLRIPLFFGSAFLGFFLAVLYAAGVILPGGISSSLWILTSAILFLCFRLHAVPLLSLSRSALVFYLYVALALLWPTVLPTIFIAVHSTAFQTADIFARANQLVAVGTSALAAGWLLSFQIVASRRPQKQRHLSYPVRAGSFGMIIGLSIPLLILAFPTESIFTVGYNGAAKDTTLGALTELNVLKPAVVICVLLSLMALFQRATRPRWIVWGILLAVLVVVLGFASGSRVEEIGCLLGVGWLILQRRKSKVVPRAWIVSAAALCIFMLVLGEVRSELPNSPLSISQLGDATQRALQLVPQQDTLRMKPSTNGDIALTLCVVIGLVETGVLEIDHGDTFLKYADMTLPRFLNPGRPVDLQVFLEGLALTGGGLFILAEPYIAGGAFGVWMTLGLFGAMIGSLEALSIRGSLRGWTQFSYVLLLSCVPRWFLYSILTMYKHVLTGVLLLLFVTFVTSLYARRFEDQSPLAGEVLA
jgi:hypothetical protein